MLIYFLFTLATVNVIKIKLGLTLAYDFDVFE